MDGPEAGRAALAALAAASTPHRADARGPDALGPLLGARIAAVYVEASAPWPDDPDERVHDVRVATRRLRAALAVAAPLFARGDAREASARVGALGRALGVRRAADVSAAWVEGARAAADDDAERAVLDRLADLLALRRRRALAAMLAEYPAERLIADGAWLVGCVERAPLDGPPLSVGLDAELAARSAAVAREVGALADPDDDEAHHTLRIVLKRLRYTCEIADEVTPQRIPHDVLSALRALQTALGDLHDRVEVLALLDSARTRRRAPAAGVDAWVSRLRGEWAQCFEAARAAVDARGAALIAALGVSAPTPR